MTSISKRLTLSLSLTVVFVSVVVTMAIYSSFASNARKNFLGEAERIVTYLCGTLEAPVWNLDYELVSLISQAVFQNELINELKVVDSFGKVLFSTKKDMSTGNIFRSGNLIHFGKTIGEVHVSFTNKSFQDRATTY